MTELLRIGTRNSALALYQTNLIARLLREAHAGLTVEIVEIITRGDRIQDVPLPQIGGKGLFTQEIEDQLLAGTIDLAVHSLKDMPTALPEGLTLACTPERAAPTDALVSTRHASLDALPQGARVATGSVRRRAQLASLRPDLVFTDLRGNIDTRLAKLEREGHDAIVMATAALHRLDLSEHITQPLDPARVVPAVGQGAITVEIRADRHDVAALLDAINHAPTLTATRAERVFMARLEGGCSAPLAAHCAPDPEGWAFHAWIGSPDGAQTMHSVTRGPDPEALASAAAERFIRDGAREMMRAPIPPAPLPQQS